MFDGHTLCGLFDDTVAAFGDAPALVGPDTALTWTEYGARVGALAPALRTLGLEPGDTVALATRNTPHFHVVDTAVLRAGGVPFSLQVTDPAERSAALMDTAGARLLLTEQEFLPAARDIAQRVGANVTVVVIDGDAGAHPETCVADLMTDGLQGRTASLPQIDAEDIATLIFTSGTTGAPKAVQLSHRAVVSSLRGTHTLAPVSPGGRVLSYLPLSHIAERFMSYYLSLGSGCTIYCVPDPHRLYEAIRQVRPTRFFAVPRVWEKLADRAKDLRDARPGLEDALTATQGGQSILGTDERFAPILAELGLDAAEHRGTATAPSSRWVLEFFETLGAPIAEIWGMSEAIMCTMNPPGRAKPGSVGVLLPGVQGRVADDGELLIRGSNVMSGYLGEPEHTAAAFDADGWLRTGDLGEIDADGYLRLVGRKKDILITATGKNVVPVVVENAIKAQTRLLDYVVAIAEGRRYVTALLVPEYEQLQAFAAEHGLSADVCSLVQNPTVHAEIERAIAAANEQLAGPESVRAWVLLDQQWRPGGDEVTPTMKLRRSVIADKYAPVIDRLYRAAP